MAFGVSGHPTEPTRLEDPFSEVLEGLVLQSWISGGLALSEPWGLRARPGLGWFYLVANGSCFAEVEPDKTAVTIAQGDLLLIPQGHGYTLRDGAESPTTAVEELFERRHFEQREELILGGGESATRLFCGCFVLEGLERSPWHMALPPFIHAQAKDGIPQPYADYIVRLIDQEAVSQEPCAQAVVDRLVRILFIKAVHSFMSVARKGNGCRLGAPMDPDVGRALGLMHRQPEACWTVALLAERVAMSRSAFAARFTELVGKPPMEYLTECRMQKACWLLKTGQAGLKEVATEVGYESAAAFSKAFSRWSGAAPGAYRQTVREGAGHSRCRMPPIWQGRCSATSARRR